MYKKLFNALMVVILILGATASMGFAQNEQQTSEPRPIGSLHPADKHLVKPREDVVIRTLLSEGVLSESSTQEEVEAAVADYYAAFSKESSMWVNPEVQMASEARELELSKQGVSPQADPPAERVSVQVFALAVDFAGVNEEVPYSLPNTAGTECVPVTDTFSGPLKGAVPPPGPQDNNTVWYTPEQISDPNFYSKLVFGYEGVGRVRTDLFDPEDGQPGINLAGYTVQDYYDHFAGEGNVLLNGLVTGWVSVPHSEAMYGAPQCLDGVIVDNDGGGTGFVGDLVVDAVNVFQAQHPSYFNDTDPNAFWPQFDGNQDGWLDTFWIIHAGMGEESGGGAEGDNAIWSHSWTLEVAYPGGYQVYEGDPAVDTDDIFIGPYTMQPEHTTLGVLAEEFGHNFFGLPDMYTTDVQNSVGFWNIMSAGSWGGYLGGSVPVGMPLWFKQIATCGEGPTGLIPCNWQYPMVYRDYQDPSADITIGQIDGFPGGAGVMKGVQNNLPSVLMPFENESGGTGKAAWSGTRVNDANQSLVRTITVPAAPATLSMQTYWEIEEGCFCDWAFVEVKGPADTAYKTLNDTGNHFTEIVPGYFGLHNWATEPTVLSFDLSAWAGQTVSLRLRYQTDGGYTDRGWWIDDLALNGAVFENFETATAPATFPAGWTVAPPGSWKVTPMTLEVPKFYLVEWRSKSKYDRMLQTAYVTTISTLDTWRVERVPYNIPAAMIYFRDDTYPEGYSQTPYYQDDPSYGPKNKLLVVDMNPGPLRLFNPDGTWTGFVLNNRSASYDSGLTLQDSEPFSLSSVLGVTGGPFSFVSKPAVTHFNDAIGYYPGRYFGPPCTSTTGNGCAVFSDSSVVIPARGRYSVRVTDFAGNPLYDRYGDPFPVTTQKFWLGSGNPGDDMVHYGVNVKLLSKSQNEETAVVRVYNYSVDFTSTARVSSPATNLKLITYTTVVENVGTEAAENVKVMWNLDNNLTFVDMQCPALAPAATESPDGFVKVCMIPTMAAGATQTVSLTARVDGAVTQTNTRLEMHDGQIMRGPFWSVDAILDFVHLFLPILSR